MNNLVLAFITGLTSGGISCATVQGGLLASSLSEKSDKYKATGLFLLSKLIAYTLLGGILGAFGEAFNISIQVQAALQILIGLFMLATAGRILNLHPVFNFTSLKPPKFVFRLTRNNKFKDSSITPLILGFLTIFIPCGVTQAMLLLSIGSGSALNGSLIMFFFTLGTSPIFFLIGMTVEKIFKNALLTKIAAATVALIGLFSINNGQVLRGSAHTFQNYWAVLVKSDIKNNLSLIDGKQIVDIIAKNNGYATNVKTLKKGVPVKLKITSKNVQSCARSFVIPSLKISKILPVSGTETIEFTPNKLGLLTFSCGMGMYTGSFNVIE